MVYVGVENVMLGPHATAVKRGVGCAWPLNVVSARHVMLQARHVRAKIWECIDKWMLHDAFHYL